MRIKLNQQQCTNILLTLVGKSGTFGQQNVVSTYMLFNLHTLKFKNFIESQCDMDAHYFNNR